MGTLIALLAPMIKWATSCCFGGMMLAMVVSVCSAASIGSLEDLAQRILGADVASHVHFTLQDASGVKGDLHEFSYECVDGELRIEGTSLSALSSGLGWYLKYDAFVHISWSGDQSDTIKQAGSLPATAQAVLKKRTVPMTYYMNVCTFSYTTVWWDWERWQRELDWMALNGINVPLAFTGQEFIWRSVFVDRFGMTRAELDEFFTGPAFLAWNRMGNIRGWAGPLSDAWIDNQHDLQVKIVTRARGLGMKTILPAFAGHVPEAAKRIWPNADIQPSTNWGGFEVRYANVFMVQPDSEEFVTIGSMFIKELIKEYGTDHLYNADTFNEMSPKSMERTYLANTAKATLASMTRADPDAIWVMQGWLFTDERTWTSTHIDAYLSGVPDDRMLILDLFSDVMPIYSKPGGYHGKSWVYNMLHNFGGNHGLYGRAQVVSQEPILALSASKGKMVGIGLTPEGIEQNYVMYELMLEMAWRSESVDLPQWFNDFARRRYGLANNAGASKAWQILLKHVYQCQSTQWSVTKSIVVLQPSLRFPERGFMNPRPYYKTGVLVEAWASLLKSSGALAKQETFRYDIVDVTRQVLSNFVYGAHGDMMASFGKRDVTGVARHGARLLGAIDDIETILASDRHWLLGTWLQRARDAAAGDTTVPEDKYMFNGKNQITMWGPRAEIADYASKQWAGLVKQYYKPRWALFVDMLTQALHNDAYFDNADFMHYSYQIELKWQTAPPIIMTQTQGDSVEISRALYTKYADIISSSEEGGTIKRCTFDEIVVSIE